MEGGSGRPAKRYAKGVRKLRKKGKEGGKFFWDVNCACPGFVPCLSRIRTYEACPAKVRRCKLEEARFSLLLDSTCVKLLLVTEKRMCAGIMSAIDVQMETV